MEITCGSCKKVYNIPDDRLQSISKCAFNCPACGGLITFELPPAANASDDMGCDYSEGAAIAVSEELREKIAEAIKSLDPLPEVIQKAREVMASPNATFKKIGDVIETDQAISAKFLKIANSAYYGLSGRVSGIHQAMVILGNQTIEQVITTAGTSKLFSKKMEGYGMTADALWKHSLAVASGARAMAVKRKPTLESDAFTAGLLHDIGKIVLDGFISKNKSDFEALTRECDSAWQAEEKLFWFDHAQIGAMICEEWKLPEIQTIAIKHHHVPLNSQSNQLACLLHVADHLADQCGFGAESTGEEEMLQDDILGQAGFKIEELSAVMDEMTAYVGNVATSVR